MGPGYWQRWQGTDRTVWVKGKEIPSPACLAIGVFDLSCFRCFSSVTICSVVHQTIRFHRLNAVTSSGASSNHSPSPRFSANRRRHPPNATSPGAGEAASRTKHEETQVSLDEKG